MDDPSVPAVHAPSDASSGLARLEEMVRESERVIDHQVRAIEEVDRKAAHLTTSAQAALGGGVLLATFVAADVPGRVDLLFLAAFSTGGILNVLSLTHLFGPVRGRERVERIGVGPDPEWVASKSRQTDWDLGVHLLSVLEGLSRYAATNRGMLRRKAVRRYRGLRLLSGALALYAASLMYLL